MATTTTLLSPTAIPQPSALSHLLSGVSAKSPLDALPLEVLHNLEYQHGWTELQIHPSPLSSLVSSKTSSNPTSPTAALPPPKLSLPVSAAITPPITLLSGLPPRHAYIHPDLQAQLIAAQLPESALAVAREFVLPASLGEPWTLRRLAAVFDALPARAPIDDDDLLLEDEDADIDDDAPGVGGTEAEIDGEPGTRKRKTTLHHRDAKRLLLGMLSANGKGGDGTIAYYVVQEGEVKPRQN